MLIKNAKIFTDKLEQKDILIEDGKIKKIGKGLEGDEEIDASGKVVLPGLIDVHVHFREPGHEYKEDFLSGSEAAAAGGVTTVLAMPNTNPPITDHDTLEKERELAKKSIVNYGLYVGATKENVEEIPYIDSIAVKAYIGSSTGSLLLDNPADFVRLLEHTDKLVVAHAEDEELLKYFKEKHGKTEKHHMTRDTLAALTATSRVVIAANFMKKRVHVAHMSTKEELEFIRKHKTKYVTCEVCPHHLFLNFEYFEDEGNLGKMNPPLRSEEDREALWKGIRDGTVDIVSTDHAPHLLEEKNKPYGQAPSGVPGVQTMLPLMLSAVNNGKINLADLVKVCCHNPADIFGIKKRGRIKEGYHADLVIVDMDKEQRIMNQDQYSKCGWTPWHKVMIKGWPIKTIVNGNVVMEDGAVEGNGGEEIEY